MATVLATQLLAFVYNSYFCEAYHKQKLNMCFKDFNKIFNISYFG